MGNNAHLARHDHVDAIQARVASKDDIAVIETWLLTRKRELLESAGIQLCE